MKFAHGAVIILLLFNSLGALFGGWSLIADPTGADLKLPANLLANSPFKNYFIPGIMLLTLIGLFSLVSMIWTAFRWKNYTWLIMAQGILLTGWIGGQLIMIKDYSLLQLFYGSLGIGFLVVGYFIHRNRLA